MKDPRIPRAAVEAARTLINDRAALELAVADVDVDPGYDGDWDIDWDDLRVGLRSVAGRVSNIEALVGDDDTFGQLYYRLATPESDDLVEVIDDEWGNQRELTADDLAEGLHFFTETAVREGWVV